LLASVERLKELRDRATAGARAPADTLKGLVQAMAYAGAPAFEIRELAAEIARKAGSGARGSGHLLARAERWREQSALLRASGEVRQILDAEREEGVADGVTDHRISIS
jgi:hypothetical protein